MAAKIYDKIPIVDTARRCGLVLDSRTLRRKEVEASCPFCGDHGRGKYHLSLNTDTDQYRCNLCGAHGNSVVRDIFPIRPSTLHSITKNRRNA